MLFDDDPTILQEYITSIRSTKNNSDRRYHDTSDPEVDRYFTSSPLMFGNSCSYEAESADDAGVSLSLKTEVVLVIWVLNRFIK